MNIGIIGAGQIGATLIRQYSKAGHRVKMTNSSGIEKLRNLALETGASGVTLTDIAIDVEVVVIAIPLIEVLNLPKELFENISASTTIIDACNYYPIRDGRIEDIEKGMPESVWVSNQIQRPVIKAYNNILAGSLVCSGLSKGDPLRLALPIAGDNKQSKDLVSTLIDDSGFDCLDCGTLQDSWRQQPGSPVYCTDLTAEQMPAALGKAIAERSPKRRDLAMTVIAELMGDPTSDLGKDFLVRVNRLIYN